MLMTSTKLLTRLLNPWVPATHQSSCSLPIFFFFLRLDLLHQIFIVFSYRSSTYFVTVVNGSGILIFRFGFPVASYVKMYLRGRLDQDGGVGWSWAQLPPLDPAKLQLHRGWQSWQWIGDSRNTFSTTKNVKKSHVKTSRRHRNHLFRTCIPGMAIHKGER